MLYLVAAQVVRGQFQRQVIKIKNKIIFLVAFIVSIAFTISASHTTFAATSDFGSKALLYGKLITFHGQNNYYEFTDGKDSTAISVARSTSYVIDDKLVPNAYVDRVYIRSAAKSPSGAAVTLTFSDDTKEVINIMYEASGTAFKDYYGDVENRSKTVKAYKVNAIGADNKIAEFDLRQGEYNPSNPADFVIKNLKGSGDYQSVKFTWDASPSSYFQYYKIYINDKYSGQTTKNLYDLKVDPLSVTKFEVSGVDTFQKEYSKYAFTYNAPDKPPPLPKPSKPSLNGSITGNGDSVTLKFFSASDHVAKYNIYLNGLRSTSVVANEYTFSKLERGKQYVFTATAVNTEGLESDISDPFTADIKVLPPAPPPVTESNQSKGDGFLLVNWNKTEGEVVKYIIYLNNKKVGEADPTTRQFKITTAMGYNPKVIVNETSVVAQFADGKVSTPGDMGSGGSGTGGGTGTGTGTSGNPFKDAQKNMPFSVLDMLKTMIGFLAVYKEYFLMATGIIFVPVIIGLVFWLLEKERKQELRGRG